MAPKQTWAAKDVRGENYSGPPAKEVPQVEDVEMVQVPEEAVQVAPAPRFECASL